MFINNPKALEKHTLTNIKTDKRRQALQHA